MSSADCRREGAQTLGGTSAEAVTGRAACLPCLKVSARRRRPCRPRRPAAAAPLPPQVNYELTLPAVREALTFGASEQRHLPIVTGFLGRGLQTGAHQIFAPNHCSPAHHPTRPA